MSDDVRLLVRGVIFEGWESVQISRSMQSASGGFALSVSERFGSEVPVRRIRPLDSCEVRIDEDVVATGFVESVTASIDAGAHTVEVAGRDRIADLIDSAPDVPPSEWRNLNLYELAVELCRPFGIAVRASVPVGERFPVVSINPGQRAFEVLEKACRQREILPLSTELGVLELTRAGVVRSPVQLREGENVVAARVRYSTAERYSHYTVKAQAPSSGFAVVKDQRPASPTVPDEELVDAGRYRPLLIVAEEAADPERCQRRARWEALTRAARGAELDLTVTGWRSPGGDLWRPNRLARVDLPTLGVSGEHLISSVVLRRSSEGTLTDLSLVRPDAFRPAPPAIPGTPSSHFGITPADPSAGEEFEEEDDPGLNYTPDEE